MIISSCFMLLLCFRNQNHSQGYVQDHRPNQKKVEGNSAQSKHCKYDLEMLYSKKSELEMLKYLFKGEVPPSPRPLVSNSSWKVFCPFFVVAVFGQNCKSCQQWWLMKVFPPRNMSISEGILSCFCRVQSTLGSRRFRCN